MRFCYRHVAVEIDVSNTDPLVKKSNNTLGKMIYLHSYLRHMLISKLHVHNSKGINS